MINYRMSVVNTKTKKSAPAVEDERHGGDPCSLNGLDATLKDIVVSYA